MASRKVVVSRAVQADLATAKRWLLQPGAGVQGRARWDALRVAAKNLADLPYKGALSLKRPEMRQLVMSGHRVI